MTVKRILAISMLGGLTACSSGPSCDSTSTLAGIVNASGKDETFILNDLLYAPVSYEKSQTYNYLNMRMFEQIHHNKLIEDKLDSDAENLEKWLQDRNFQFGKCGNADQRARQSNPDWLKTNWNGVWDADLLRYDDCYSGNFKPSQHSDQIDGFYEKLNQRNKSREAYENSLFGKLAEWYRKSYDLIGYSLSNIVINFKDETSRRIDCSADLKVELKDWGWVKKSINYSVQNTTDGNTIVTITK